MIIDKLAAVYMPAESDVTEDLLKELNKGAGENK
jgi:hypothetical protein